MRTTQTDLRFVRDSYPGQREPVQDELVLARDIQRGLLPHQLPASPYFELKAFTVPSFCVGGDHYDAIVLPGGRFGFTVADVSGKGLPAAILSASLQGAFAAVALDDLELPETFSRVNDFLYARTSEEMYATMFYGIVSPDGDFSFVNAGHTQPRVVRGNGSLQRLEGSNFPLGLFSGITYEAGKTSLDPGDMVLLFSDGLTEAQDFAGDLFGESRLDSVATECIQMPAALVCETILKAVRMFAGPAPQSDDLTLLVLRFGPS